MKKNNRGVLYGWIDKIGQDYITAKLTTGSVVGMHCREKYWPKHLNERFSTFVMNELKLRFNVSKGFDGRFLLNDASVFREHVDRRIKAEQRVKETLRELNEPQVTARSGLMNSNYNTPHAAFDMPARAKEVDSRVKCIAMTRDAIDQSLRQCRNYAVAGDLCRIHLIKPTKHGTIHTKKVKTVEFRPEWDMPRTKEEALAVLKCWGRQDTLTFSYTRARRIYELLSV